MRKVLLGLIIIGCLYSCKNKDEQTLTTFDWEIEKIIDLKTENINLTKDNQHKIWDFRTNNTYVYKTVIENTVNQVEGKWTLDGINLLVYNEFDTISVIIEDIHTNEMVWLVEENDSIRLYLNSKEKEIAIPDFSNLNN